jgi:hypothetical protein
MQLQDVVANNTYRFRRTGADVRVKRLGAIKGHATEVLVESITSGKEIIVLAGDLEATNEYDE